MNKNKKKKKKKKRQKTNKPKTTKHTIYLVPNSTPMVCGQSAITLKEKKKKSS